VEIKFKKIKKILLVKPPAAPEVTLLALPVEIPAPPATLELGTPFWGVEEDEAPGSEVALEDPFRELAVLVTLEAPLALAAVVELAANALELSETNAVTPAEAFPVGEEFPTAGTGTAEDVAPAAVAPAAAAPVVTAPVAAAPVVTPPAGAPPADAPPAGAPPAGAPPAGAPPADAPPAGAPPAGAPPADAPPAGAPPAGAPPAGAPPADAPPAGAPPAGAPPAGSP
jgi:hypothetical protein